MLKRLALYLPVALALLLILLAVAGFLARANILRLVPPEQVSIAAGRPGGGYYSFAEQYRDILARDGIEMTIVETAGSMDNSRLLATGEVDIALIQGGTPVSDAVGLEALAAVFLEPFLILHRSAITDAADPTNWADLRVAAGEPGSGTRIAINRMIEALEVDLDQSRLLPLAGAEAATALIDGTADIAVFVAPISAPYLEPVFSDPDIRIETLRDAEALARRLTFVKQADIPPAGLDYSRRLPPERVELTAMIATLAARGDLHPALVDRLLRAAIEVHSGPNLLSADLAFPMAEGVELPINRQAGEMLRNGPNRLDAVLPYWMAAQVTRLLLIVLPLLILLLPLLRTLPGIYTWSIRSKIYRRYKELVEIDAEAERETDPDARRALLERLDRIDSDVRELKVPARYREQVYTFRLHIDLVRSKLTGTPATGAPPADLLS
ncbi:TAXI family TRAP transporter solute-binding subunit [Oceanomicrobium pacificus]|uniref:ABC transporter substrate-binding protein n=1 Tax=Oceanomicrobium pacificus TaxID=2692916 RepID=A0A6B0TXL7_9RHOB|nr:TAXI family TRAP transporter solute-binding subunit [Oceanomicrobium pacificus]MXU66032.1 ABC transporter substrate-binding protein [Oceanomicrobium pacificus]